MSVTPVEVETSQDEPRAPRDDAEPAEPPTPAPRWPIRPGALVFVDSLVAHPEEDAEQPALRDDAEQPAPRDDAEETTTTVTTIGTKRKTIIETTKTTVMTMGTKRKTIIETTTRTETEEPWDHAEGAAN